MELKSASEIREIQGSTISKQLRYEIERIATQIENAIKTNDTYIYYYPKFYPQKNIIDKLESLEYKVSVSNDQRDGYCLKIEWGK